VVEIKNIGYLVLEGAGIAVDMIGHRLVAVKHLDLKKNGKGSKRKGVVS